MFAGLSIPLMVVCIIVAKVHLNMGIDDKDGLAFTEEELKKAYANHKNSTIKDKHGGLYDDGPTTDRLADLFPNLESEVKLWTNGTIPYRISSGFVEEHRDLIGAAIEMIRISSCINFKHYSDRREHYLNIAFDIKDTCKSEIGSQRSDQKLYLGDSCFNEGIGIILHELLHVLGIGHEHSRPDRDEYIQYKEDRTVLARARIHPRNFDARKWGHMQDACEDYDVSSIMHYPTWNNNILVFNHTGRVAEFYVGQRITLSKIDRRKINRMYKCDVTDPEVLQQIQKIENDIKIFFPDFMKRCTNCTKGKQESCMKLVTQLVYC